MKTQVGKNYKPFIPKQQMKYFVNDAKSLKCKVSINVVVLKENLLFRAIES